MRQILRHRGCFRGYYLSYIAEISAAFSIMQDDTVHPPPLLTVLLQNWKEWKASLLNSLWKFYETINTQWTTRNNPVSAFEIGELFSLCRSLISLHQHRWQCGSLQENLYSQQTLILILNKCGLLALDVCCWISARSASNLFFLVVYVVCLFGSFSHAIWWRNLHCYQTAVNSPGMQGRAEVL